MKTLIASKMCMLYCALIVCSLALTVRTTNTSDTTTAVTKKVLTFNSSEVTTRSEQYDDFLLPHLQTTSIAILKNSSTTPETLSVTDPNKLPHSDETTTGGFSNPPSLKVKPNKGNSVSGKRNNSSERIPTNGDTRSNSMESVKKSMTIWEMSSLSPITQILLSHNFRMQEMEKKSEHSKRPPMHARDKNICKDPEIRKYLARCQNKAKETRETGIQRKYENYTQQKTEMTTIENEIEKEKKLEIELIKQVISYFETEIFNRILDMISNN